MKRKKVPFWDAGIMFLTERDLKAMEKQKVPNHILEAMPSRINLEVFCIISQRKCFFVHKEDALQFCAENKGTEILYEPGKESDLRDYVLVSRPS